MIRDLILRVPLWSWIPGPTVHPMDALIPPPLCPRPLASPYQSRLRALGLRRIAGLLAIGILLAAAPVRAQSGERDDEARALFEAGRSAYAAGRYDAALRRFQEAFEISGRTALLYNVGACADRLRRDEEALAAYRGYLEATGESGERRRVAEERIALLEGEVRERRARAALEASAGPAEPEAGAGAVEPEGGPGAQANPAEVVVPTPEEAAALATEGDADPMAAPALEEPEGGSGALLWVGLATGGALVVGAAIVAAVLIGGSAGTSAAADNDLGRSIQALQVSR